VIEIKGIQSKIKPASKTIRDGKLIGIVGVQGSGKSLTMAYLSAMAYYEGEKIYSNFHLYGGFDYTYLNNKEDVFNNLNNIRNSSIFVDEFHSYLDAYNWRDPEVIKFVKNQMVTARRKGNKFIMGNQLKSQFPYRLRTIIPLWLVPRIKKFKRVNGKKIPKIVEVYQVNKDTQEFSTWKYKAEPFLNLYDTYEDFDHILLSSKETKKISEGLLNEY